MMRNRLFVLAALVAGASLVAACSGSAKSAPHGSASSAVPVASTVPERHLELKGAYVQPPIKISGVKDTGSKPSPFRGDGGTIWHGDLEGRTTFVLRGLVSLQTQASHGTNDETFTGSVASVGSGRLHFQETFTVSERGVISIDATIIGGDGALSGLRGRMHFAGHSDLGTGAGTGTYTASLVNSN